MPRWGTTRDENDSAADPLERLHQGAGQPDLRHSQVGMSCEGRFTCGGVTPLIRLARAGSSTTLCCGPLGSARIAVSILSQPRLDIPHISREVVHRAVYKLRRERALEISVRAA